MLTGSRRGEVMSMRWDDLDLPGGKWTKPGSGTKQKKGHEVPLSAPVKQLLSEIASAEEEAIGHSCFQVTVRPVMWSSIAELGGNSPKPPVSRA